MSDTDVVAQRIKGLVLDLRRIHREDGEPSFETMTRRVGYSKSTFHRLLQGKDLPKWDVLQAFLTACRIAEADISRWKSRWIEIKNLIDPIPVLTVADANGLGADAHALPAGDSCHRCGLRIGDQAVHDKWHEQFVPRAEAVRRVLTSVPA